SHVAVVDEIVVERNGARCSLRQDGADTGNRRRYGVTARSRWRCGRRYRQHQGEERAQWTLIVAVAQHGKRARPIFILDGLASFWQTARLPNGSHCVIPASRRFVWTAVRRNERENRCKSNLL